MKFTLNIYEKKQIVKTYEADSYDLMFGTLEDFLSVIDEKILNENISDFDFAKIGVGIVKQSLGQIKPLLLYVFDGLTEEELRKTKAKELIGVILAIAKYSFAEINGIGSEKNV